MLEICFATPGSRLSHCAPVRRRMSEGARIASSRLPLSHFSRRILYSPPLCFLTGERFRGL